MKSARRAAARNGMILVENICLGYQLSTLLKQANWHMRVLHEDRQAYALILSGKLDVVIADIESKHLGGLAVLAYCKRHWPKIATYAIARHNDDAYLNKLALDMGGCRGFFYLSASRLEIDPGIGMAARLMRQAAATHPQNAEPPARRAQSRQG